MKRRTAILFWLLVGWLIPAMGEPVVAPRWLPLAEVLKQWENQPLEAIQQAAEKGEPTACHYLGYAYAEGFRGQTNAAQAIAWYERGIALGYLPSANNLGFLHFKGKLVARDVEKALRYYRVAADGGFPNAQAMLGFIYEEGNGVKQDHEEALKWFRRAADRGHAEAMVHLGRHYRLGQGVPKNVPEASKWFRAAAGKGEPAGTLNLGWLYGYEQDDPAAALKCFREAAQQGLSEAMYELYLSYGNGKGVAQDRDEARRWLTLAAEAGLARAQYRLGTLNDNPDPVTWRENPIEAIRWYRQAADQNWPGAQLKLAQFYLRGTALEPDEARALELVRAAADQEYAPALQELAGLYARGIGEPRRREDQPLQLLKRVTQLQEPGEQSVSEWAYEEIARRHQYGLGTEKDLITAAQWYCRGAAVGVWFFSLDDKTESRPRIRQGETSTATPDERGAISLILPELESDELLRVIRGYLRVATAKDGAAAMLFGERYLAGRDAPRNAVKAWCWFKLAADNGAAGASAKLSVSEARLGSEQRVEAVAALAGLTADLRKLATVGIPPPRRNPEQP